MTASDDDYEDDDDVEWWGDELADPDALTTAASYWGRRQFREALHWLEQALGRDFDGLADLKPEDLR